MNKKALIIVLLIGLALVGWYAYNEYSYYRSAPYLVLRQVESTYPKGEFTALYKVDSMGKVWTMRIASDGKGHVRQDENDPDARVTESAVFDFPGKKVYWLQRLDKIAVVHPLDGSGLGYADENLFTYGGQKLGAKTIAKWPSHGWRCQLAGQPMESWFSDLNGCLVESSVFGKHVLLISVKPGPPAPAVFQVPADYQIKPLK